MTLFNQPDHIPIADGELYFDSAWLETGLASRYQTELLDQLNWRQDDICIAGRTHKVPRLEAWYGDAGAEYGYSGLAMQRHDWHCRLKQLRDELNQLCAELFSGFAGFNSVLANLYRDGQDSVGWHSDDEPELGKNPIIASVSLGATRKFSLKHKSKTKPQNLSLELNHGSLLIMSGPLQHHWRHQIAKTKLSAQPRINLTFRRIIEC